MKNITKYFLAALAMTAAASCAQDQKDELNPVTQGKTYVFTAALETDTKALFDEASMKTLWSAGADGKEHIAVLDGTNVRDYVTGELAAPVSIADFSAASASETLVGNVAVAVYPYSASELSANLTGENPVVTVPYAAEQTATASTFDPKAAVAVAYNGDLENDNTFKFSNASALLKLQVKGETPITSVEVKALGESPAALAGNVVLTVDGVQITASGAAQGASSSVKLVPAEGTGALAVGTNYYIAVAPATLAEGVSVKLNNSDELTYTITRSIALERNKVYNLGTFPYEAPSADATPMGKQYLDSESYTLYDFGVTKANTLTVADILGYNGDGTALLFGYSYELALTDLTVVQFDNQSGYMTWTSGEGEDMLTYKLSYSNLTDSSVDVLSVNDDTYSGLGLSNYDGSPVEFVVPSEIFGPKNLEIQESSGPSTDW